MVAPPERPAHLPDYRSPPLNEVVLGVQFSQPQNYQQILAGKVWELYRHDYPKVRELSALPPTFETFGLSAAAQSVPQIRFESGGVHDRFWFIREKGDELIQFQNNKLLHNWRKSTAQDNPYPRFEAMIAKFENELRIFETFAQTLSPQRLSINQVEISYINHIYESPLTTQAAGVLNFFKVDEDAADDFSVNFRKAILDEAGNPYARFICEATTGIVPSGKKIIVLSLHVRGAPKEDTIESAMSLVKTGREIIVQKFSEITSAAAQEVWERIK